MGQHRVEHAPGEERYRSFADFYPFYLSEHANRTSRRLHVVGTGLVIISLVMGFTVSAWFFLVAPLVGYGFAWVGHFVFEKNRPATFTYPLYSLMGDFRLFFETVAARRRW
ncbi:Mpo1-like protein [Caulobacter endophyticus]|uniref:Mpo1-like protein n=1 Tax=Caulobacter endophyticus TaxID=2172652 RepID=UPI00240EEEA8|nr:Mpo1-like protein [Caulobacter endophyticus]MDG2529984.1 DUF962 domain-containing protein [Caulobacter endophyticus]